MSRYNSTVLHRVAIHGALDVTVRLLDGRTRNGRVSAFSPFGADLLIETDTKDGIATDRIAIEAIACVGLHAGAPGDRPAPGPDLRGFRISLVGGGTIAVEAFPADLWNPLGFYAVPVDPSSPFRELFFFGHGVTAKESEERLGAMLVKDGAVTPEQVERAATRKAAMLGAILIEQDKLDQAGLDEALADQERQRLRLGEVLVERGMVTAEDVDAALEVQKSRGKIRIGEALLADGAVSEETLLLALSRKFNLAAVDLDRQPRDPRALDEVGRALLERHLFLPLETTVSTLTIAIADPLDTNVSDLLRFQTRKRIVEVLATPSQLRRHVERVRLAASRVEMVNLIHELEVDVDPASGDEPEVRESDSTIIRLANQIIVDAIRHGASDVHIEPNGRDHNVAIRFRVDGDCSLYQEIPPPYRGPLVARLKIMARLDIAERRKPQDGKIRLRVEDRPVELRVATLPTVGGNEDVVMRVLSSSRPLPLDQLAMSARNLTALRDLIERPYGLILCVGPTGSGKTTTLHAALGAINTADRKIWTAEDPVEITQRGLRQLQVLPKIGLTFAAALRAFLRADPDVIMIGEMRDLETASIAVEASLTGHLVLSTLHTNSASETVTRLLDMGLDPFSFADALLGVLAQRLARASCATCREPYTPDARELEELRASAGDHLAELPDTLWRGAGCVGCNGTGLRGRVALHELLVVDDHVRDAVHHKASVAELRRRAVAGGMTTLLEDGIDKVVAGRTRLQEVLAVCSR